MARADGDKALLIGHSAGGWLARAVLLDEAWGKEFVRGLVTLGAPHQVWESCRPRLPRAGM